MKALDTRSVSASRVNADVPEAIDAAEWPFGRVPAFVRLHVVRERVANDPI